MKMQKASSFNKSSKLMDMTVPYIYFNGKFLRVSSIRKVAQYQEVTPQKLFYKSLPLRAFSLHLFMITRIYPLEACGMVIGIISTVISMMAMLTEIKFLAYFGISRIAFPGFIASILLIIGVKKVS